MKYYQLKRKAALLKRNIYKSQFQINEQNKVSKISQETKLMIHLKKKKYVQLTNTNFT